MENIDYKKLYTLQDKILTVLFDSNEHSFYLTGGTALNRFYSEIRYSEDLDFFSNDNDGFRYDIESVLELLQKEGFLFEINTKFRDFYRIFVNDSSVKLKIDFVNDRVKHIGKPIRKDNILLDNLENIYANKLTALLSRDEAKDVVDIWLLDRFYNFDITKIIQDAKEKMFFMGEDLFYRLKTFPKELLSRVDFVNKRYKEEFLASYNEMCIKFEKTINSF